MILSLTGCASGRKANPNTMPTASTSTPGDPLEGYNRFMFKINDAIDRNAFEPIARGYRDYVPSPARTGLRNFLHNLRTPVNAANNILQGDVEGFATDISRFTINTTIGIGGLIDIAKQTGLEYRPEDFGQTMGVWGIGQGPYFVIPLLGPSTIRDTAGLLVDTYADPVRIYLYNTHNEGWYYARSIATSVDERELLLDAVDDLRRHSFDFYAATRSAYLQERAAMVANKRPGAMAANAPTIPDYSDPAPAKAKAKKKVIPAQWAK